MTAAARLMADLRQHKAEAVTTLLGPSQVNLNKKDPNDHNNDLARRPQRPGTVRHN